MMSRLPIIFLLFFVTSCKSIHKKINHINKDRLFNSLVDYKTYVDTKTNLDIDKFYFVNDADYNNFLFDVASKEITYFYGLIKHKKIIADGSNLKERNTCYTAIVNYVNDNYANEESTISPEIIDFKFYNFHNEEVLLDFDKELIVYIYSHKLGRLANALEELITEINKNTNFDYIILSIDNTDIIN